MRELVNWGLAGWLAMEAAGVAGVLLRLGDYQGPGPQEDVWLSLDFLQCRLEACGPSSLLAPQLVRYKFLRIS